VKVLEVEWLNDKTEDFFLTLADADDPEIFEDENVIFLLGTFNFNKQIIVAVFVPFLLYFGFILCYYSYVITDYREFNRGFIHGRPFAVFLRFAITIMTSYSVVIEIFQISA
jgi:hypothetical protein